MQATALIILIASGVYLIVVGIVMIVRPGRFLHLLSLTASSWRVNFIEQGLRLTAGLAMIARADRSKLSELFEIAGWFVVVSSLILLAIPLKWHAGYAMWWARRIRPMAVRAIGPVSAASGLGLAYAAW